MHYKSKKVEYILKRKENELGENLRNLDIRVADKNFFNSDCNYSQWNKTKYELNELQKQTISKER